MKKYVLYVLSLLLLFLCTANSMAKMPLFVKIKALDASHFPLIQAFVSVADPDGAYYRNLTENDFSVCENRILLNSFIVESGLKSMNIVLCLDTSGSMKKNIEELKRQAFRFIKMLDPADRCMIIDFNNEVNVIQRFTNDKYALANAIFSLKVHGGTALYDAIYQAISKCQLVEGKKAIIVITDGKDESYTGQKPFSRHTLEEVIVHAKQVGVPVYTIGLGKDFNETVLSSIANETEGTYYFAPTPYEVGRLFKLILQSFKTYHKITYASPRPYLDGTARVVEFQATVNGLSGWDQAVYMAPGGTSSFGCSGGPVCQPQYGKLPDETPPRFRNLRSRPPHREPVCDEY